MDNDKIGKFIQQKRLEKGLTQNELGDKLYVTGKAVSKWERGLSLPDISILEQLAEELDTDIYEILQIKKKDNIDINKLLQEEKNKLDNKYKKTLVISIFLVLVILIILFKFLPFGYNVDHLSYEKNYKIVYVDLGKSKFSFDRKSNEESYTYKNMRSKSVLMSEMKNFVNTLEHISCNDTTYYYNKEADLTIINYRVDRHIGYNTMVYDIKEGNYCDVIKKKEYSEKIGGMSRTYSIDSSNSDDKYQVTFSVRIDDKYTASLVVYKLENKKYVLYENSNGTFTIKGDELIYKRDKIINGEDIPMESSFIIRNNKLIHKENYLPVVLK